MQSSGREVGREGVYIHMITVETIEEAQIQQNFDA